MATPRLTPHQRIILAELCRLSRNRRFKVPDELQDPRRAPTWVWVPGTQLGARGALRHLVAKDMAEVREVDVTTERRRSSGDITTGLYYRPTELGITRAGARTKP
jgi:hypothetical protein